VWLARLSLVTDIEALDLSELVKLLEYVLVEVFEVLLDLARVNGLAPPVDLFFLDTEFLCSRKKQKTKMVKLHLFS
jgi:hypothetical protein